MWEATAQKNPDPDPHSKWSKFLDPETNIAEICVTFNIIQEYFGIDLVSGSGSAILNYRSEILTIL